ncbi:MAG: peptidoglycan editing factor PgeF, partial [Candidatus Omnitrophica bacterium]|nr:peptidoglycan editing factor PgeF [Candidatus Omnitrophota bacterium]
QLSCSKVFNIRQVHGKGIIIATGEKYKEDNSIPQTDAIITKDPDVPIAVRTADCLPIFIFDPKQNVIAIVHAGWRSTQKRIGESVLKKMKTKFKTRAQDVKVAFGPALCLCCYEVTEEFLEYFPKEVKNQNGKLYLDLSLANKRQLLAAGVLSKNIFDCKVCTFCGKNYFSYRKDKEKAGRMLSVMMLKNHK